MTDYPPVLRNSFFGVSAGAINYNFSAAQLEPGNTVETIRVPHSAVRITLYGRHITKNIAAQVTYMRPVGWVQYKNINGQVNTKNVWMNVAGLTVTSRLPLNAKFSFAAEAGLGIITRKGFSMDNRPVITDANYASLLAGASLQYHVKSKWDLRINMVLSPENKRVKQPQTLFIGAGFHYQLRASSVKMSKSVYNSPYQYPRQFLVLGFTTNALGYGVNNAVSKGPVPIFWGGEVHVKQGYSVSYQRNIFHTRKVFALDWGAGFGHWTSRDNKENFFTLSLFPVLRFTAVRTKPADFFFEYAVAGPTYISQTIIDKKETGKKFTFYDFMGMGVFAGQNRNLGMGIRIAHFSNGNLFPRNDGIKIPLTFNLLKVIK
ncbi:MAG TPA: acyloxyacyl hydrolase [Chitinophagaceae bacterium]|nr:acyloxyacyl hydrolase [Chitinophagaceae bacterium]